MSEEYKVQLDVYQGPLDLLLYLIKREEVDIHDIPIARIADQYGRYVQMLQQVDINLAGEFLVMAATLMEIKSAMLLPHPPAIEEEGEDLSDPRVELIRQLLAYKQFKDAALELEAAHRAQADRFNRRPGLPGEDIRIDPAELDLGELAVWDLLAAFQKVMSQVLAGPAVHQVVYDDTPIDLHAEDILDRLRRCGEMTFERIFEGRIHRSEIIGLFLALLELIRQKRVVVSQPDDFGAILVAPGPMADQPLLASGEDAPPEPDAPAEPPAANDAVDG